MLYLSGGLNAFLLARSEFLSWLAHQVWRQSKPLGEGSWTLQGDPALVKKLFWVSLVVLQVFVPLHATQGFDWRWVILFWTKIYLVISYLEHFLLQGTVSGNWPRHFAPARFQDQLRSIWHSYRIWAVHEFITAHLARNSSQALRIVLYILIIQSLLNAFQPRV